MTSRTYFSRLPIIFLGLIVVLGAWFAPVLSVHAQVPPVAEITTPLTIPIQKLNLVQSITSAVNSAAGYTLDYVLNGLAWDVANLAIESITKSTVNWINSGFEGSPAFVTDLKENLRGVGDAVAGRFFDELAAQAETIDTGLQDEVLDGLRLAYYLRTSPESFYVQYPSTLNRVSSDSRAFLDGDFSKGGFDAFFATTMNLQDSPYGQQLLLQEQLSGLLSSATNNRLQELSWGRGFQSLRACDLESEGNEDVNLAEKYPCDAGEVRTPGSVIEQQLNATLDSGRERLIVADQFNEIVGALLNQLVGHVLGANGSGGLSGVSRPSSGGGSSFLDSSSDTGSGTRTASAFTATITDQKRIVETYQANWRKIQTAADAALAKCSTGESRAAAQRVAERAQLALVKAASTITAYNQLLERIERATAIGGNQSANISSIANDFTQLSRSNVIPTGEEIAEAQVESQDTGTLEPGSLYSQMDRLSKSLACQSSGT